ncbi:MAG: cytochrome c [Anaerolineae bacterium]|nr:cytochrome c [Anaerolineae bacterium]
MSNASIFKSVRRRAILPAIFLGLAWVLVACGPQAPEIPPTPTLSPELADGQRTFIGHCGACHSTADTVIVGPGLGGIAERAGTRIDGLDARSYIYNSILQPSDFLVPGFDDLMPKDLAKKLTGEELDHVVLYLLSLK